MTGKGGRGILLGGVPGVVPGTVIIIGGGVVGINSAKMFCGLGANVIAGCETYQRVAQAFGFDYREIDSLLQ
ncbi:MAG: hypothetical protein WBW79_04255 [Desulfocapsaceae bacterium]